MSNTSAQSRLLLTRSQLAAAFGVTPLRVSKWAAEGMPVAERGGRGRESRYDLAAVVEWQVERRVQARGGGAGGPLSLADERAKLTRLQSMRAAMELKAKQRDLLPRDQVVREGKAFVLATKAKLLALPRRIAQAGLIAVEQQPAVADVIREALEEMARWSDALDLETVIAERAADPA